MSGWKGRHPLISLSSCHLSVSNLNNAVAIVAYSDFRFDFLPHERRGGPEREFAGISL